MYPYEALASQVHSGVHNTLEEVASWVAGRVLGKDMVEMDGRKEEVFVLVQA